MPPKLLFVFLCFPSRHPSSWNLDPAYQPWQWSECEFSCSSVRRNTFQVNWKTSFITVRDKEGREWLFYDHIKGPWQTILLWLYWIKDGTYFFICFLSFWLAIGWGNGYHKHHLGRGNVIVCQIHKLKLIFILPIPVLPKFLRSRHNKIQ